MAVFLLFGPTLFVWYYMETHMPSWDRKEGLHTFLWGALLALPFFLVYGTFGSMFSLSVEGWKLFAKGFFLDLVLPLFYILASYVLWHRKRLVVSILEQGRRFLAFGAGGFFPIALQAHISFRGWEEGFQYLLIPFLWIQLLYVGCLSLGVWFSTVRWERFLVIGGGMLLIFLMGWFSYLYRVNIRFISSLLILGSFVATTIIFPKLIDKVKYL